MKARELHPPGMIAQCMSGAFKKQLGDQEMGKPEINLAWGK